MTTATKMHNVRVVGKGHQAVVLSHGFGGSQDAWERLVPYLVPDYKVVLYDLKGHGSSGGGGDFDMSPYRSMEGFAADLVKVLSELQLQKCLFVGHSMSGIIGCLAATAHPELFSKIILLAGSPRYMDDVGYEGGFTEQQVDGLLAALKSDHTSWIKNFAPNGLGPDASSESIHKYTSSLFMLKPEFMLLIAETIFKSDHRKILPLVPVPCHVVQTGEDFAVPRGVAKYLQQQLRGELRVLEGIRGHLPHVTHPQVLAPVLRELFLVGGDRGDEQQ